MLTIQDLVAFYPYMARYLSGRIDNPADREEVVQETALAAWQYRDKFDPQKSKASTWLTSIMRNCCWDHFNPPAGRKIPSGSGSFDALPYDAHPPTEPRQEDAVWLTELLQHPAGRWLVENELNPTPSINNSRRARASKLRRKMQEYAP